MVKLWFVPTWLMLGVVRVLIKISSFRRLVRFFGVEADPRALQGRGQISPEQEQIASNISTVVRLAAKYSPWRANCFPQALCASMLLNLYRLPFVTFMGLSREPTTAKVTAHAWVRTGSLVVTGDGQIDKYALVGCFASRVMGRHHTRARGEPERVVQKDADPPK